MANRPTYSVLQLNNTAREGDGPNEVLYLVGRDGDVSSSSSIKYRVAGTGTDPASADDFVNGVFPMGQLDFIPGERLRLLNIGIAGDRIAERDEGYTITLDGGETGFGTITNDDGPPPPQRPVIAYATESRVGTASMQASASDGPSYLRWTFIQPDNDGIAVATNTPDVFIRTGSGTDAIQVTAGTNVLDGGLGSNFLTGGSGLDTYFTDARGANAGADSVWTTIRDFQVGEAMTLWGFNPGTSRWWWDKIDGAAGFEGATMRADLQNRGVTDASVTFTGMSMDEANRLTATTGSQPAGTYLYLSRTGA